MPLISLKNSLLVCCFYWGPQDVCRMAIESVIWLIGKKKIYFICTAKNFTYLTNLVIGFGHADVACWNEQKFDSCWKKNFNSYALMPSRVCTVVNKRLEDWNLRIQRLQRCASLICVWNAVDWGLFFYAPCWYSTLLVNIHLHSVSTWEEMTKEVLYSVLFFVNTSTPPLPPFPHTP